MALSRIMYGTIDCCLWVKYISILQQLPILSKTLKGEQEIGFCQHKSSRLLTGYVRVFQYYTLYVCSRLQLLLDALGQSTLTSLLLARLFAGSFQNWKRACFWAHISWYLHIPPWQYIINFIWNNLVGILVAETRASLLWETTLE